MLSIYKDYGSGGLRLACRKIAAERVGPIPKEVFAYALNAKEVVHIGDSVVSNVSGAAAEITSILIDRKGKDQSQDYKVIKSNHSAPCLSCYE